MSSPTINVSVQEQYSRAIRMTEVHLSQNQIHNANLDKGFKGVDLDTPFDEIRALNTAPHLSIKLKKLEEYARKAAQDAIDARKAREEAIRLAERNANEANLQKRIAEYKLKEVTTENEKLNTRVKNSIQSEFCMRKEKVELQKQNDEMCKTIEMLEAKLNEEKTEKERENDQMRMAIRMLEAQLKNEKMEREKQSEDTDTLIEILEAELKVERQKRAQPINIYISECHTKIANLEAQLKAEKENNAMDKQIFLEECHTEIASLRAELKCKEENAITTTQRCRDECHTTIAGLQADLKDVQEKAITKNKRCHDECTAMVTTLRALLKRESEKSAVVMPIYINKHDSCDAKIANLKAELKDMQEKAVANISHEECTAKAVVLQALLKRETEKSIVVNTVYVHQPTDHKDCKAKIAAVECKLKSEEEKTNECDIHIAKLRAEQKSDREKLEKEQKAHIVTKERFKSTQKELKLANQGLDAVTDSLQWTRHFLNNKTNELDAAKNEIQVYEHQFADLQCELLAATKTRDGCQHCADSATAAANDAWHQVNCAHIILNEMQAQLAMTEISNSTISRDLDEERARHESTKTTLAATHNDMTTIRKQLIDTRAHLAAAESLAVAWKCDGTADCVSCHHHLTKALRISRAGETAAQQQIDELSLERLRAWSELNDLRIAGCQALVGPGSQDTSPTLVSEEDEDEESVVLVLEDPPVEAETAEKKKPAEDGAFAARSLRGLGLLQK